MLCGMEHAGGGELSEERSAVPAHVHHLGLLQHAWAGPVAGLSTALPKWAISHPGSRQHSEFHNLFWQRV